MFKIVYMYCGYPYGMKLGIDIGIDIGIGIGIGICTGIGIAYWYQYGRYRTAAIRRQVEVGCGGS